VTVAVLAQQLAGRAPGAQLHALRQTRGEHGDEARPLHEEQVRVPVPELGVVDDRAGAPRRVALTDAGDLLTDREDLLEHAEALEHGQPVRREHERHALRRELLPALEDRDGQSGVGAHRRQRQPAEAGAHDRDSTPSSSERARVPTAERLMRAERAGRR
jgi:hypothetical protein